MNKLFIIEYECAHWCGGSSHCIVWAQDEEDAKLVADFHMEESMRELYAYEYNDEFDDETETGLYDYECSYTVKNVESFGPGHDNWEFYLDPEQAAFYPIIGEQE